MQQTIHLPFDVALLPVKKLSAGKLTCLYEYGNVRSIQSGGQEVIRMIYTALRDENWATAPYEIQHEIIVENSDSFSITYTAFYHLHNIRYKADITIEGNADNTISFTMKGEALSTFNRNRIGICVLHPIESCAGKTATIEQPGGSHYTAVFPQMISPHQPFKDIQEMKWPLKKGMAQLSVEGDIFETEDQRNWGDNSYKTYSTPHSLPIPVLVKEGDTIKQKVVVTVEGSGDRESAEKENIAVTETKFPFPEIGYSRTGNEKPLTDKEITLLRQLPFHHYRVELHLNDVDWTTELATALTEAKKLETALELIIFSPTTSTAIAASLIDALEKDKDDITSLLILQENEKVTPAAILQEWYDQLKKILPNCKLGYGTDGSFVEVNRNPPNDLMYDFVSFSLSPQAHLTDTRTIIDNLPAQSYLTETAKTFIKDAAIHVSPVMFKPRDKTDNSVSPADPRFSTSFGAFWTLAAIKNLSGASSLTFYQTKGSMGLLKSVAATDEIILHPVYEVLVRLKSFQPKWVIRNNRERPSPLEPVVFENEKGERLAFVIDDEK